MKNIKQKIKLKEKKISERKLMIMSCSSYLLGTVCLGVFGYFYDTLPFRDILYIIPVILFLLGAFFSLMLNIRFSLWKGNHELTKKDIKEINK